MLYPSVVDDDFRGQLERRIVALRASRAVVQDQLRDLHHELNSLDRRIDAAEELYRREYGIDPPDMTSAVERRRATRIRRQEKGQPSWREAIIGVLRQAGEPLHV